eukprot:SAG31_NODE_688_length_12807_cov_6.395814_12_plen_642_part_00
MKLAGFLVVILIMTGERGIIFSDATAAVSAPRTAVEAMKDRMQRELALGRTATDNLLGRLQDEETPAIAMDPPQERPFRDLDATQQQSHAQRAPKHREEAFARLQQLERAEEARLIEDNVDAHASTESSENSTAENVFATESSAMRKHLEPVNNGASAKDYHKDMAHEPLSRPSADISAPEIPTAQANLQSNALLFKERMAKELEIGRATKDKLIERSQGPITSGIYDDPDSDVVTDSSSSKSATVDLDKQYESHENPNTQEERQKLRQRRRQEALVRLREAERAEEVRIVEAELRRAAAVEAAAVAAAAAATADAAEAADAAKDAAAEAAWARDDVAIEIKREAKMRRSSNLPDSFSKLPDRTARTRAAPNDLPKGGRAERHNIMDPSHSTASATAANAADTAADLKLRMLRELEIGRATKRGLLEQHDDEMASTGIQRRPSLDGEAVTVAIQMQQVAEMREAKAAERNAMLERLHAIEKEEEARLEEMERVRRAAVEAAAEAAAAAHAAAAKAAAEAAAAAEATAKAKAEVVAAEKALASETARQASKTPDKVKSPKQLRKSPSKSPPVASLAAPSGWDQSIIDCDGPREFGQCLSKTEQQILAARKEMATARQVSLQCIWSYSDSDAGQCALAIQYVR